jgi:hypothetical protein
MIIDQNYVPMEQCSEEKENTKSSQRILSRLQMTHTIQEDTAKQIKHEYNKELL